MLYSFAVGSGAASEAAHSNKTKLLGEFNVRANRALVDAKVVPFQNIHHIVVHNAIKYID